MSENRRIALGPLDPVKRRPMPEPLHPALILPAPALVAYWPNG